MIDDLVLVFVSDFFQLIDTVSVDHMIDDGVQRLGCVSICCLPVLFGFFQNLNPCLMFVDLLDRLHCPLQEGSHSGDPADDPEDL